jgi:hypothetical protein
VVAPSPTCFVTALYDYEAKRPVELSFRAGERLWLPSDRADRERDKASGWWFVTNDECQSGYVPSNYTDMNVQSINGESTEGL